MKYATVCSGIEAPTVAWHELGWDAVFYSEIDRFPNAVLSQLYPGVPNYGDMMNYKEWPDANFDVLCGGTPCQSFSVAGLRKGLDDPRGNLTLVFLGIALRYKPRWVCWENVPGVLSDDTEAFGSFLGGLAELGYGWAYRMLNAKYFGVPQNRKRIFVVGHLGDWRRAAAVLLEPESVPWNFEKSRKEREDVTRSIAPSVRASGPGQSRAGDSRGQDPLVACPDVSPAIKARDYKGVSSDGVGDGAPLIVHALRADGFDASEDGTGRGTPIIFAQNQRQEVRKLDNAGSLSSIRRGDAKNETLLAFGWNKGESQTMRIGKTTDALQASPSSNPAVAFMAGQGAKAGSIAASETTCPTLRSGDSGTNRTPSVAIRSTVRRLTPKECARLQGFPDEYLDITVKGKLAADGSKYKALGNAMAVPVVKWIGERIDFVDKIPNEHR